MTRKEYFDKVWHRVWIEPNNNYTDTVRFCSSCDVANFYRLFYLVKDMNESVRVLSKNLIDKGVFMY